MATMGTSASDERTNQMIQGPSVRHPGAPVRQRRGKVRQARPCFFRRPEPMETHSSWAGSLQAKAKPGSIVLPQIVN